MKKQKFLLIQAYCPSCGDKLVECSKNKKQPIGYCKYCDIKFKWQVELYEYHE